jgi:hypothetical protein
MPDYLLILQRLEASTPNPLLLLHRLKNSTRTFFSLSTLAGDLYASFLSISKTTVVSTIISGMFAVIYTIENSKEFRLFL